MPSDGGGWGEGYRQGQAGGGGWVKGWDRVNPGKRELSPETRAPGTMS